MCIKICVHNTLIVNNVYILTTIVRRARSVILAIFSIPNQICTRVRLLCSQRPPCSYSNVKFIHHNQADCSRFNICFVNMISDGIAEVAQIYNHTWYKCLGIQLNVVFLDSVHINVDEWYAGDSCLYFSLFKSIFCSYISIPRFYSIRLCRAAWYYSFPSLAVSFRDLFHLDAGPDNYVIALANPTYWQIHVICDETFNIFYVISKTLFTLGTKTHFAITNWKYIVVFDTVF